MAQQGRSHGVEALRQIHAIIRSKFRCELCPSTVLPPPLGLGEQRGNGDNHLRDRGCRSELQSHRPKVNTDGQDDGVMVMWILGRNHMCQITIRWEDRRIVSSKDPPKNQQTLAPEGSRDSTRFERMVQKAVCQKGLDD